MYTLLEAYFAERTAIDAATMQHVCGFFTLVSAKRGEVLLSAGQVCKHYYFVNQGCIRLYSINEGGEEATRYFAFEGAFGTSLPSLINQQPAFEYVQAIEASELLVISRTDFYHLVDTVAPFAAIYRQILELSFITAQKRIYGFQGMDALARVRWTLEHKPLLLSRISNRMAASYFGISPSTLSRLKAKVWAEV